MTKFSATNTLNAGQLAEILLRLPPATPVVIPCYESGLDDVERNYVVTTEFEPHPNPLGEPTMSSQTASRKKAAPQGEPKIGPDSVVTGANGHQVYVDGVPLLPDASLKLRNHSPSRFGWGYGGSGSSQTALAILMAADAPQQTALALYQKYKWEVIARLTDQNQFTLLGCDVIDWLDDAILTKVMAQIKYAAIDIADYDDESKTLSHHSRQLDEAHQSLDHLRRRLHANC